MQYQVQWLERPWLLLFTLDGTPTMPDYEHFSAERQNYLDTTDGHLYVICDWRKVHDQLPADIFIKMAQSPAHRHPNCAVMAVVGNHSLIRLILSLIVQKSYDGSANPAVSEIFPSVEMAEKFCRATANVDPMRAKTTVAAG